MSYIQDYLINETDPSYDKLEEEPPSDELQEKYISNTLAKLERRLEGTDDFITLHGEDEFMYPQLSQDIKNDLPFPIIEKILKDKYKSEIPAYHNLFWGNRLFPKRRFNSYGSSLSFVPGDNKPKTGGAFDQKVLSKTVDTQTTSETKKKVFTSSVNLSKKNRNAIVGNILKNDLDEIITRKPRYVEILPELIKEENFELKTAENDMIKRYIEAIDVQNKVVETSINDIDKPFIDKTVESEADSQIIRLNNIFDDNINTPITPIFNIINHPGDRKSLIQDSSIRSPPPSPKPFDDVDPIKNSIKPRTKHVEKVEEVPFPIDSINKDHDLFNVDYNDRTSIVKDIPYRRNIAQLDVNSEIDFLGDKINFVTSILEAPIPRTIIDKIEDDTPIPKPDDLTTVSVVNSSLDLLEAVDTNIDINNSEIVDRDILYVDIENFEVEWGYFLDLTRGLDIDERDIYIVKEFTRWLVKNNKSLNIELTCSVNPFSNTQLELIYNGDNTNTTVGDLLMNVSSHQMETINNPIWELVDISNPETLLLYDDRDDLDVNNLTIFKILSGYYNRTHSNNIKFHSSNKLLQKVEKQINNKISGLDDILDILNNEERNEIFRGSTKLLDNIRNQTRNFYFEDYAKNLIHKYSSEMERKNTNSGSNFSYLADKYSEFKSNPNNVINIIEMIFYDYFNSDINSFLGISNSEPLMNTNNEIGEIMNEVRLRSLIQSTNCYNEFTIAMMTLIVSTFYLTFFSYTLKLSKINGSENIIKNLCSTIAGIKNQMMSENLNNDNIYTLIVAHSSTLEQIHTNRMIEYQNELNSEIAHQENTPKANEWFITDEIEIDEYQVKDIPSMALVETIENEIENMNNIEVIPNNVNIIQPNNPIPMNNTTLPMNIEERPDNVTCVTSNKRDIKEGQKNIRAIKNVMKEVNYSEGNSKKDKQTIKELVKNYFEGNKISSVHKNDLKRIKNKVIKDFQAMKRNIILNEEPDIPSARASLELANIYTPPENLPQIEEEDPIDMERIKTIRKKILRKMKVSELTSENNKKLIEMIKETIQASPPTIENSKLVDIIENIITAEGMEIIRNQRDDALMRYNENIDITDDEEIIVPATISESFSEPMFEESKKALAISYGTERSPEDIRRVLENIKELFPTEVTDSERTKILGFITKIANNKPAASVRELTKIMKKKLRKVIQPEKRFQKVSVKIIKDLDLEGNLDPELTTKHRDLIFNYMKKKHEKNPNISRNKLRNKVFKHYQKYLNNSSNKNKNIATLNQSVVPF